MFNITYEIITLPIKHLALNYVESHYLSTQRKGDIVELLQKKIQSSSVVETVKLLATGALLIGVMTPVAEELIFRGLLHYSVTWITGSEKLAVLTSTAVFALVHYTNNNNPLDVAFQLADCYFIYNPARASGGLLASMAAHSFHNLASLLPIFTVVYTKSD